VWRPGFAARRVKAWARVGGAVRANWETSECIRAECRD
jgi:hypothetical protein